MLSFLKCHPLELVELGSYSTKIVCVVLFMLVFDSCGCLCCKNPGNNREHFTLRTILKWSLDLNLSGLDKLESLDFSINFNLPFLDEEGRGRSNEVICICTGGYKTVTESRVCAEETLGTGATFTACPFPCAILFLCKLEVCESFQVNAVCICSRFVS